MKLMKSVASIVFSKDRAMQLQAALESFHTNFMDQQEFVDSYVLYKCSQERYRDQYHELEQEFPDASFVPEIHLASQVRQILSQHPFVFFQVDDNITTSFCFIRDALMALDQSKILGFSYRLGRNTDYCYMLRSEQKVPNMRSLNNGTTLWFDWVHEEYDFGYPLEVSSSIYRSADILPHMTDENVTSLVMIEGTLNRQRLDFATDRPLLACYPDSRMFSLPLNNTSGHPDNRAGELKHYSEAELADFFAAGKRLKLDDFYGIQTNSCHQEFLVEFVEV